MAEKIEPIPNIENALEYLEYTKWFIPENHSSGYPKYPGGTITNTSINNKMFLTQTFEIEEKIVINITKKLIQFNLIAIY